jgi:hypothetical protein
MKLDDVLAMAGEHQLSNFGWGASAVILYNGLVPTQNHIDVSYTGKQAYDKLRTLPSFTLVAVLTREVHIEGMTVDFVGASAEQSLGVPPTVPHGSRRMSPVALLLMVTMMVISLALVFGTIQNPGKPVNTEALQAVLSTMTELMKEDNRAHEASQKPKEAPAPNPSAP